ncbi:ArsB/NhaD family transporter [Campylobacter jejuni]
MLFLFFLSTLILLFWRPWNLPIWVFSSLGAFFVFIFQLVDFKDAYFVFPLVWDSSLTLVGLIILFLAWKLWDFLILLRVKFCIFLERKIKKKFISAQKIDVVFVDFCIFSFCIFC